MRVAVVGTGTAGLTGADIVKELAAFDGTRAARLLGQALLSEDFVLREHAERELTQFGKTEPNSAMAGFGAALLESDRGWVLQVSVCRDLLAQIPAPVVLDWVRKHGLESIAQAVARHLPLPYLDNAGKPVVPQILDAIFREFDDDKVFVNFWGGAHSWRG